jgi:putative copper export protein
VLPVHSADVRLFLHIAAATVWVGGQFVLAGLVPVLRRLGSDVATAAGRQFQRIAWPAFAVLLITGGWNLAEVHLSDQRDAYIATVVLKLSLVALSGIAAAAHTLIAAPMVRQAATPQAQRRGRALSGITGALALLAALGALFVGVQLRMS